jgi:hypothetical protein
MYPEASLLAVLGLPLPGLVGEVTAEEAPYLNQALFTPRSRVRRRWLSLHPVTHQREEAVSQYNPGGREW